MEPVKLNGPGDVDQLQTKRNAEVKPAPGVSSSEQSAAKPRWSADEIKVSARAADVAKLVGKLADLPAVRNHRIDELRGLVQSGSYNQSSTVVADAILRDER